MQSALNIHGSDFANATIPPGISKFVQSPLVFLEAQTIEERALFTRDTVTTKLAAASPTKRSSGSSDSQGQNAAILPVALIQPYFPVNMSLSVIFASSIQVKDRNPVLSRGVLKVLSHQPSQDPTNSHHISAMCMPKI
jgi:hypothetical protein